MVSVLLSGLLTASGLGVPAAALAATVPALMPAAGQYFPITPVKVLDTRDGTGGVAAAPLASGATATFLVGGVGQVPDGGVADAYVVINAISPQASGCLDDYDADLSDPGICTVSFRAGENFSVSDIVQVSDSGYVSVTNTSTGATDVAVTVLGYYQNGDLRTNGDTAGDTYVPLRQSDIVDTRSGLGAPQAQIPAGGSLTVQVTGKGGIPASAPGAALFIGAANASQAGYVSAYPTGSTASNLSILSYVPNRTVHDLYFGALSSAGQLTLVNQGPSPVDLMVGVQGYLLGPSASPAGDTYQDVPELRIADTRYGTGGIPSTPVPPGGSITFTATGVDGVPTTGVPSVAESVAALNATSSGYLSVYPAGTADPQQPGVNFNAGDGQDNDMSAPLLSAVSPTGQETVTNHSSGTVDVVVSVRGYYQAPAVPGTAHGVIWSSSSPTSATVSWLAPYTDGGSPITGYTVTAPPDTASVTVGPGTYQATLTSLSNASADDFTVTATNAVGAGPGVDLNSEPLAYTAAQSIGIEVSDTGNGSPTVTDLGGTSTVSATSTSGITTTTSSPANTSNLTNDAPPAGSGPTGVACDYVVHKDNGHVGNAIETLGDFNNTQSDSAAQVYWINHLYALPKARYIGKTLQWEAFACTAGGGKYFASSGYEVGLSENALMTNSTNPNILWNYNYPNVATSTSTVTTSKGLALGAQYQGASVTINASQSVTTTKNGSQVTGSLGNDGNYGSLFMPPDPGKYYNTRVNTEWLADSVAYESETFVGSVAVAIWMYPQVADNVHQFYSVTVLGGCFNETAGPGWCANTNGGVSNHGS